MVRWLAALAAMIVLALPAWAAEEITRFGSEIATNRDSSLDVIEHITVNVEGMMIQRGIFRDFPTRYKDRMGNPVRINFDVTSVKRDGKPENYALESIANGTRIRIGNRDVMLRPGVHVYDIAYHVDQELGFFGQFDELYWNVTGNSWNSAHRRCVGDHQAASRRNNCSACGIYRAARRPGQGFPRHLRQRVYLCGGNHAAADAGRRLHRGGGLSQRGRHAAASAARYAARKL
ncbi:DUF2207 domain-containing protein [Aestuariivirga sp.]|uniref:DUF2207 domain-containing protein n=1 Tax=Aestuariivirga sp. TaxID=2650926 RepID=UPI0039E5A413